MAKATASWKKWALIVSGTAFMLLVGFIIFVIAQLPSRGEIARKLAPEPSGSVSDAPSAPQPTPAGSSASTAAATDAADASVEEKKDPRKKARQLRQIMGLMEEDRRDVRVCANLGQTKVDLRNRDLSFDQIFNGDPDTRDDSVKEALRMPLREIFQEPHLTELLREVAEIEPNLDGKSKAEREGFFEKVGFYSRVATTAAALYANRQRFEDLGDRTTHLMTLTELVARKPELRDDSAIQDYCRSIESPETVPSRNGLLAERKRLLDLIARSGLKPSELNFDPDNWVRFSVESGKDGLRVSLNGANAEERK